jgi:hypothetical protein
MRNSKIGLKFLGLGAIAFAGLGLEGLLFFLIEPLIYSHYPDSFSTLENISHWILTCLVWGIILLLIVQISIKKYSFNMFSIKNPLIKANWLICAVLVAVSIVLSIIDWDGFKIIKEFTYNGWLKFIFQYIYYIFESVLFVLMIVFGQRAGEIFFGKKNIPWGGIFTALTWGLVHMATKGSLSAGISSFADGLLYGLVYIACRKNLYVAFPIILFMFVL